VYYLLFVLLYFPQLVEHYFSFSVRRFSHCVCFPDSSESWHAPTKRGESDGDRAKDTKWRWGAGLGAVDSGTPWLSANKNAQQFKK